MYFLSVIWGIGNIFLHKLYLLYAGHFLFCSARLVVALRKQYFSFLYKDFPARWKR